jgi:hypothetical protein
VGKAFLDTESTIGINQLTVNVNYAALGDGNWNQTEKPKKEYEAAVAENILKVFTLYDLL